MFVCEFGLSVRDKKSNKTTNGRLERPTTRNTSGQTCTVGVVGWLVGVQYLRCTMDDHVRELGLDFFLLVVDR